MPLVAKFLGRQEMKSPSPTIYQYLSSISCHPLINKDKQGKATFTKKNGESATLGTGPYKAVYGTAPAIIQTYSADAPALPMSAESNTTALTFSVSCGLLELSLAASESITSIEVTGIPTGGAETTYTLTCSNPVSIASGAKFFIALPAGSYTSFLIKGQNGAQCKKEKLGSSIAISANHISPISFTSLHFAVQLWAGGPYWATTNIGATTATDYGHYFAWGYTDGCIRNSGNYGWVLASDSKTVKQFNTMHFPIRDASSYQDAAASNWGTGWNVPTDAHLKTLINKDNSNRCSVSYVTTGTKGIRVTGTETGYTSNSIFLPAAGWGNNSTWVEADVYGYYWSSVSLNSSSYILYFKPEGGSSTISLLYGCAGYSIRPVRPIL